MRKNIFCLIIIYIISSTSIFAQIKAGLNAGVDMANASYSNTWGNWNKSGKMGITIGGNIEFNVFDWLSFAPGLNFTQKGIKANTPYLDPATNSSIGDFNETLSMNFIGLPLMLKAKLGSGGLRPFIYLSPNIGYLLSANSNWEYPGAYSSLNKSVDYKNNLEKISISMDFGIGVEQSLSSSIDVFTNFGYSLGINNIDKEQGYSYKDLGILAVVGFKMPVFTTTPEIIQDTQRMELPKKEIKRIVKVQGIVQDVPGKYLEADVSFYDISDGNKILITKSNIADGVFKGELPVGKNIRYTVNKKGFLPFTDSLDLINDTTDRVLKPVTLKIILVTIKGKVIDGSGNPLEAEIKFDDLTKGENITQVKSSASNGDFTADIPIGKYYGFTTEKKGYFPVSDTIDLRKDSIVVTKTLKPIPLITIKEMKEKQITAVIKNIFFDFDKFELKAESYYLLDKIIEIIKDNPNIKIEISAHTDNRGKDEYNQELSKKRAQSVVDYLINNGCNKNILQARGYGKAKPIATNDNDEGRAINRRVEFRFIK